jgi:predicted dehydrogenase
MSSRTLTVGLIGYQFMGKAHSNAYRQANRYFDLPAQIRMKTLCGRTESAVSKAADNFGWEGYETDWRKVVEDPEIDIIDVATPGNAHFDIVMAAAAAGKIVFCEKPIGNTLDEAEKMAEAIRKSGRPNGVWHNYRKSPAVALAKRLIEEGEIGEIYHFRGHYLQDWIVDPNFPLVWRLQKAVAGSGTHGDIHSHIIDMARYLVGEFDEVMGLLHTFIKERPVVAEIDDRLGGKAGTEMAPVDVDDAALMMARFKGGALGMFEASRFALGRKNYNRFEINGSKGSLVFNQEKMNELEFYSQGDREDARGFRLIQASDGCHPYAGRYWPVAHIIGYEQTFINWVADAVEAIVADRPIDPNFEDGLKNQRILDAVERSHSSRSWVSP